MNLRTIFDNTGGNMTEARRLIYAQYFGDMIPASRREAIALDPNGLGAADIDMYCAMSIEKPKPRKPSDFEGKPLGKRATRKLLRQLREEFSGSIMG